MRQGASALSHFRPQLCLHLNFVVALSCTRRHGEAGSWEVHDSAEMKEKQTWQKNNELALLVQLIQAFEPYSLFLISPTSHYKVMKNSYHLLCWTQALRSEGEKLTTVQSELADCTDTPSFLARSPSSLWKRPHNWCLNMSCFFVFFFNGKGMHPRCLSKTWQLFIVNRVAGGSTKKVCLFWTNRDKRSLFTHRYDGCYNWEFPVCMIMNHTSENQNILHVDHVYEYAYVF